MFNRDDILRFINERKHVPINALCDNFDFSPSTARRVVAQLEKRGRIGRFHGGAYAINQNGATAVIARQELNAERKMGIARAAAEIISDDSTCIILGGSTVGYMCRFIRNKNITVITNSIIIFDELKRSRNTRLIVLGGLYNPEEEELGGITTNANLSYLRADYLFMGASSFDEKSGFINRNYSIDLYRACINTCNDVCVLVDSTKYNRGGTSVAATPRQVKHLFTDSGLPEKALKSLEQNGVIVTLTRNGP
jgi:DeoR/GlpR family transcriptional regulator of sugar metabolism